MKNFKQRFLKRRNLTPTTNVEQQVTQELLATEEYREVFLRPTGQTARMGKTIYIPHEHHARMVKIVQTIGGGRVSISDYLSNVITEHFESFRGEITELYRQNNESIF